MKIDQNKLKSIFRSLSVLCTLLYLTGCKPYSTTALYVYNLTDKNIILEENFNTEEYQTTHIPLGRWVMIGDFNRYDTDKNEVFLQEFISNPKSDVKIYVDDADDKSLVLQWKYEDSCDEGKQFFNDLFWSTFVDLDVAGCAHYSYIFTITQDDIE